MANKKISELPLISLLSGSTNATTTALNTVVPVVMYGTTNQITVENFSKLVTAYNATTASNHFKGSQFITGSLVVTGDITAERYYIETITSSVIYESGSTVFGNSGDDIHTFTGSIILNGSTIGFSQLNAQTASQDLVNRGISSVTGSINTTTSSFDNVFLGISSVTGAMNTTTSSFDNVFLGISSVTGSINAQSSSQDLVNRGISSVTGSINTTTSSFDNVFLRISSVTGSINTTTSSFNSVFLGISSVTGAMNTQSSSQNLVNLSISTYTGSQNIINTSVDAHILKQAIQTGSQDLVNLGISSVTGSLIGITNGLMAFTAALDSTYATDAQLYQLYQATSSIHSTTQSLNVQTGSQDLVNRGISSVTGSINTTTSSFNSVFSQIGSTTSSLIGITNGLMAFTAALDSTYATDAQLYQLYQATASIQFATQSLNVQTGSQDLVNNQNAIVTSSFRAEIGGIESYTASLKSVAIVSSSTQISNYYKFAETASANTFYGNQKVKGNLDIDDKVSISGSLIVSTSINQLWATPEFQLYNGLGTVNLALTPNTGNQLQIQAYGTKAEILQANEPLRLLSPQLQFVKYDNTPTVVSVTGSIDVKTGGVTGSILATNGVVSSSTQIQNYFTFAQTSSANTFYGNQTFGNDIIVNGLGLIGGASQLQSAQLSVYGSVLARNGGVDASYQNAFLAQYSGNSNEANAILTAVSSVAAQSGFRFDVSDGGGSSARTTSMYVNRASVSVVGAFSKGSGTFKIDHPLESKKDTHHLVHSFVEGPRADLIYRGKVTLVNGQAVINIDETVGMTEGTFVALNRDVQCFTTNESGWDLVKGKVVGNILTILSNNSNSTDEISWMVIGERQDEHIKNTEWTDANGKPILEPTKISGSIL